MSNVEDLIEAVKEGDLDRVGAILDASDDLTNQRDESGATPLHYATLNGHFEIARLLVERGADVNSPDGQFGAMPAGWAIEYLREVGGLRDFWSVFPHCARRATWTGNRFNSMHANRANRIHRETGSLAATADVWRGG
jgi:hypothetical protein